MSKTTLLIRGLARSSSGTERIAHSKAADRSPLFWNRAARERQAHGQCLRRSNCRSSRLSGISFSNCDSIVTNSISEVWKAAIPRLASFTKEAPPNSKSNTKNVVAVFRTRQRATCPSIKSTIFVALTKSSRLLLPQVIRRPRCHLLTLQSIKSSLIAFVAQPHDPNTAPHFLEKLLLAAVVSILIIATADCPLCVSTLPLRQHVVRPVLPVPPEPNIYIILASAVCLSQGRQDEIKSPLTGFRDLSPCPNCRCAHLAELLYLYKFDASRLIHLELSSSPLKALQEFNRIRRLGRQSL